MKKFRIYFKLAIACIWIAAAALFSIQFVGIFKNASINKTFSYMLAGIFWLSIITEQILFWNANKKRKEILKSNEIHNYPIGFISFMKTAKGKLADIALIISLILTLTLILLKISTGRIILFSLSTLFLSAQLHCFYNGRNYRFFSKYEHSQGEGER